MAHPIPTGQFDPNDPYWAELSESLRNDPRLAQQVTELRNFLGGLAITTSPFEIPSAGYGPGTPLYGGNTGGTGSQALAGLNESYERTRARENAIAAGLDAEIDADIARQAEAARQQGGSGGTGSTPSWRNPGLIGPGPNGTPGLIDPNSINASQRDWSWGRAAAGLFDAVSPLPDYVRDGIGRGINNPDGWFQNFFRGGFDGPAPPTGTGSGSGGVGAPSGANGPGNQGGGFFGTPQPSGGGNQNSPAPQSPVTPRSGVPNNSGGGRGGGGGFGLNNGGGNAMAFQQTDTAGPGAAAPTNRRDARRARRQGRRAVLTPEQIQLLSSITGQVQSDIGGGQGFGLDPLAQGAYDNISRQFGAGSEFGRLGEEAGLKLLRGEQLIPYSDPGREQFYKEAFLDPATANFQNDILPDIAEQYAGRGLEAGRSGDFLNAQMTAGRRLATDLGAQRANLLRGDQDRALLGLGQAFGAASTPQEIAFNTGQQNRFLQNPYSNPAYGVAPLALGTQPYATRARSGGSNTGQLVGAGLGALAGNYLSNRGGGGGYPTRSAGW